MIKELSLDLVICQNKDIDATDLNGEKVMMNIEKGKYFALNRVGSSIWDKVQEPKAIKNIISELVNEYDIDNETCEKAVLDFVEKLMDSDIIHIV